MFVSPSLMRASRHCVLALSLTLAGAGTVSAQQANAPASFADLAQAKLPSVVTITATSNERSGEEEGGRGPGFGLPPGFPQFDLPPGIPFEDFFRRFGPGGNGEGPQQPSRPATALGSGFIIDPSGYVVTNNHVVSKADEVKVVLQDEREFNARIVGTDPKTDLALLKIDGVGSLPAVAWGNSERMRIGDWVLAIGNPFGLGGTVTAGIISARARDIGAGPYDDFLQTDAAINRGNSGGPMFNMAGEVIGVNTAIFLQSGGNIGIGFAVPAEVARPIIAELRETGKVTRGWLGVAIQPVTPEIAEALGLDQQRGALVAQVTPDSPAAKAGIEQGDVITQFDGRQLEGPRELSRTVAQTDVGKQISITVLRDGKSRTLDTTITQLEETLSAEAQPQGESGSGQEGPLGLTLAPVSPEMRKRFDLGSDASGAVVVQVKPNSPAAMRGLRPGDLITQAGRHNVDGPSDVANAVKRARDADQDHVLLLRQRDGNSIFVPLPINGQTG
ncbi:DegQ family serine endoprotease [Skermanella pratensis]|uniref:DegQ family serine endoprotease n=1 Tax=Skermanella pratensis TaxID=2233999 RepID=UPI0013019871|nr:DegQ family serine endoprotease [Skermanella pratensis]